MFISEVLRLIWIKKSAIMELLKLFSYCSLELFTKHFEFLFNTILGQDDLTCDDVGWWSGLNKGVNIIDDVDIGFCNTVEGIWELAIILFHTIELQLTLLSL